MATLTYSERTAVPAVPVWRLTVDQYHAMIRADILSEADPVEFLEGLLVPKMTKNPNHSTTCEIGRQMLRDVWPDGWHIRGAQPLTTGDSEPEPDIMIVQGRVQHYRDHHPGSPDVALIVEVADSTLQQDQTLKKRLYARAGIPVYWIMNLLDSRIEVYTDPTGPAAAPDYRQQHFYGLSEAVPVVIAGHEIARLSVEELLT